MKAIIIDDEPKAISLLQRYLEHFPQIQLVATFRNGLKALSFLNQQPVGLIFLDINMPHISGVSLARILDRRAQVIFTTAHSEYAVESYDLAAVDYLLKPITLERFTQAVQKVMSRQSAEPASASKSLAEQRLLVKSGSRIYQLEPPQIYYLEKDHNYMLYHLSEEKVMARQSVAEALEHLPDTFVQIHKSFIVNTEKIDFFDKQEVSVKGRQLSIGASFREVFLARMMG